MLRNYFLFLLSTLPIFGQAQRNADKILEFNSKVKDLIIVPFNGIAAISDGTKMYGYNPEEEKIIWSVSIPESPILSNVENSIQGIDTNALLGSNPNANGADFSIINDTPFLQKFFNQKLYVINSFNGELVFEPEGSNIFFYQAEYLFDEDALLLRGLEGDNLVVAKYNLGQKKYSWKTTVSENFRSILLNFFSIIKLSDDVGESDKMTYSNDKIFLLAKGKFYAINKENGNLLWLAEEAKKEYKNFYSSKDGDYVILSESVGLLKGKELLYLYKASDGSPIWKDPIKTKYLVLFEDWKDKMLLAHFNGFNFYDYGTGQKLWKKDPKGKGIKSVIPIDKDFLYVYDDEIMLLDKNGQKKWKKDVKICDDEEDPIFFLEKTNNGKILYVTASYANLVDYTTGRKIWKGNLKLNEKRPTFAKFNENTGGFVIYNDEKLYRFNENSSEKPKPYSKLKLKNEKLITNMELYPDRVTITGQSEVVGINNSGEVLFHNKYTQPGEFARRFAKSALMLGNTVAAVATASVQYEITYRDSEGNEVKEWSEPAAVFGERAKAIGEAGYMAGSFTKQFVQNRFNALQESDSHAIIFAKGDNGERLLIKVDKQTGEEVDKLIVENTKPIYDYDTVSEDLYYSRGKNVMIFKSE